MTTIYTDGSCNQNKKVEKRYGGWAIFVLEDDNEYTLTGAEKDTTNNRMELSAFLEAIKIIHKKGNGGIIVTDSAYISQCFNAEWYVKWMNNGWVNSKKQAIKNQDLWKPIIDLYLEITHHQGVNFKISKVKAHDTNKYNNLVDKLAKEAREKIKNSEV